MKPLLCKTFYGLTIALVIVGLFTLGAGVASAQDVYRINYFANNNIAAAPDVTVRISNPGLTYGNLCAMIYVFDNDQQLTKCCGCVETQNGSCPLCMRARR